MMQSDTRSNDFFRGVRFVAESLRRYEFPLLIQAARDILSLAECIERAKSSNTMKRYDARRKRKQWRKYLVVFRYFEKQLPAIEDQLKNGETSSFADFLEQYLPLRAFLWQFFSTPVREVRKQQVDLESLMLDLRATHLPEDVAVH